MTNRKKASQCFSDSDYEGYVKYSKLQYEITNSDEDLKEYERALKIKKLSEEINQIILKEEDSAYKILDIGENASQTDIKAKFRLMATRYHPTKTNVKGSADAMRIIQKAYFEINTEEKKKAYDNKKATNFLRTNIDDVFSNFRGPGNASRINFSPYEFTFSTSTDGRLPSFFFENLFTPNTIYTNLYRRNMNRRRGSAATDNPYFRYIALFIFIFLVFIS